MYNKEDIYEAHDDFKWDEVYENEEGPQEDKYVNEGIILQRILEFLHPPRAKPQASLCRLYGLIFMLRPAWLGKSLTQTDLARMLGVSKSVMNAHVNEVRREWGLMVGGMRSDKARAIFSKLCKARASELADARRASRDRRKALEQPSGGPE